MKILLVIAFLALTWPVSVPTLALVLIGVAITSQFPSDEG